MGELRRACRSRSTIRPPRAPIPAAAASMRDPFPGNMIPQSRFSAVSQQIHPVRESRAPEPPGHGSRHVRAMSATTTSSSGGTTESPTDKGSVKIDQNFGSNHHLSLLLQPHALRFASPGPSGPAGLPEPLWNGQVSHYERRATIA